MNEHRLAEERSIALHREVAAILRNDPSKLEIARERVRGWQRDGRVHPHYADAWARAIAGPFDDLLNLLVDESENARALRQSTPFSGIVDPRTRWRIWREVKEDWTACALHEDVKGTGD